MISFNRISNIHEKHPIIQQTECIKTKTFNFHSNQLFDKQMIIRNKIDIISSVAHHTFSHVKIVEH